MDQRVRLLVFAASPSDTTQERACLRAVIDELNRGIADEFGLVLNLVGWETHSWPGAGSDVQDVINREIPDPDVLVGIFWKRLGTPTQRGLSGTAEEIERALELKARGRHVEVLIYFNQAAYTPQQDELQQIGAVLEFRHKLAERGVLIGTYTGVSDFESKVRGHLIQVVRSWPRADGPGRIPGRGVLTGVGRHRAASGRSQVWRDQIMAGHLTAEIDPPLGGRAYSFVSTVGLALADAGYTAGTCDRVSNIFVELLNNVARHAEGAASIELQADHTGWFKSIEITVASKGPVFDIGEMINTDIAKLKAGDREHGLLRVRRLAGLVKSQSDPSGTSVVHCEVYERPKPDSFLYHSPAVLPICFEYDFPQFLWVGEECYSEDSFELLSADPAFEDFFFSPLAARDAPWLGLEFIGRVVASDRLPLKLSTDDQPDLPVPQSPVHGFESIGPAIRNYFRAKFESRQVVVCADDTEFYVKSSAGRWARAQQLPFFGDGRKMMDWLAQITPGAGAPPPETERPTRDRTGWPGRLTCWDHGEPGCGRCRCGAERAYRRGHAGPAGAGGASL